MGLWLLKCVSYLKVRLESMNNLLSHLKCVNSHTKRKVTEWYILTKAICQLEIFNIFPWYKLLFKVAGWTSHLCFVLMFLPILYILLLQCFTHPKFLPMQPYSGTVSHFSSLGNPLGLSRKTWADIHNCNGNKM